MDGDARNGKAFFSDEDEEAHEAARPAFDPAAVLRAIAAEDEDDEDEPPRAFDPTSILRAIETEDEADETVEVDEAAEDAADGESALRAVRAVAAAFALSREDAEGAAEDADTDPDDHDPSTRDEPAAWAEMEAGTEAEAEAEYLDAMEQDFLAEDHESERDDPLAFDIAFEEEAAFEDDAAFEDGDGFGQEADEALVAAPHFARMDELDLPGRKPRIALMGEFSAGKSTLSNLLIGAQPLPMKVTATQLPPVWISWGDGAPYREDIHGETHPIDIDRLAEIDPAETRVIRIFQKSEVLEHCDIIDMPGISDPNMESEVWERVIDRADGVIWCTHATQAWRQSEASVWDTLAPRLSAASILLVTRFDKILSDTDRARVMRRVERETEGLFTARLPISLTRALAAGEDAELLEDCGAADFVTSFFDVLEALARKLATTAGADRTRPTPAPRARPAAPAAEAAGGIVPARILPRRVRPVSRPAPSGE